MAQETEDSVDVSRAYFNGGSREDEHSHGIPTTVGRVHA